MHLDSDLLRTFVAVADMENFTKAAGMVGRTQSAVSLQIKRLEYIVGNRRWERGPRGGSLTRRGEELLVNARRMVTLLNETAAALAAPALEGRVSIGIPEEYGTTVLPRALATFNNMHSNVEIMVRYASSSAQMAALERGDLDLAVVFEWQDSPRGEVLMVDPTVWATSETHHVHGQSPVPIALYENSGWCTEFAIRSLENLGLDYRVAYRSDTSGGLKLAVASGLAIAPLSRSNIPPGCRELTTEDGFGGIDASNVVLYQRPNARGAAVNGMADAIRDAFRMQHGIAAT